MSDPAANTMRVETADDVVLVLTTCPDEMVAERIARLLVEEDLAACVNEFAITASTFRWHGEVERAAEVQLVIKTVRARLATLSARIGALHPYELPELIVVDAAAGSAGYLAWVRASTTPRS
jgi:periplasmic divalent cation tolerance protein